MNDALSQFLGITGSAISIDVLKSNCVGELWIRVPREDCSAVVAAVGGWTGVAGGSGGGEVGWRVLGRGGWLGVVCGGERVGSVWGD